MNKCLLLIDLLSRTCSEQRLTEAAYMESYRFREVFLASIIRQYKQGCFLGHVLYDNLQYYVKDEVEDLRLPVFGSLEVNKQCLRKQRFQILLVTMAFSTVTSASMWTELTKMAADSADMGETSLSHWRILRFSPKLSFELSHTLAFLIDTKHLLLRILDPNGSDTPYIHVLQDVALDMRNRLSSNKKQYTIEALPSVTCPKVGLQTISQTNVCALWSILLAYLSIACPQEAPQLSNWSRANLIRLIQGFQCFVYEYSEITGIIEVYNFIQTHPKAEQDERLQDLFHSGRIPRALLRIRRRTY